MDEANGGVVPKPPGIGFSIKEGALSLALSHISKAEDKIYDVVDLAIEEGMTVTQFLTIAREAWQSAHESRAQADDDEFKRNMK